MVLLENLISLAIIKDIKSSGDKLMRKKHKEKKKSKNIIF